MTKKKKLFLLFSLSILCVSIIIPTIFYSLGYRIDKEEKKIIKAGSFYFRVWPRGVSISISPLYKNEDIITKKTLFNSLYIENIIPKEYLVVIEKEGFNKWEKKLELKSGLITESKNITLVKKDPYFSLISEDITDFFISPDEKKIALLKDKNIYLLNLSDNKMILFPRSFLDIKEISFTSDSKKILVKNDNSIIVLEIEDFSSYEIKTNGKITFSKEENIIYLLEENILYKKNLLENKIEKIKDDVLSFIIIDNSLFCLNKEGFLEEIIPYKNRLNEIPLEIKENNYEIMNINSSFFIKEGNNFYAFNREEKKFILITNSALKIGISNNNEKIFLSDKNEIRILFLRRQVDQPTREENEIIFLSRFSEEIKDIFWWTNHYLIISLENNIKIIEIDNRDKINIFDLTNIETSKFYWSRINRKVFLLSNKSLYYSESLVF